VFILLVMLKIIAIPCPVLPDLNQGSDPDRLLCRCEQFFFLLPEHFD